MSTEPKTSDQISIEPPNQRTHRIRRLHSLSDAHVSGLAELLIHDCVDGGASA